jgi:hypothetical protein
MNGLAYLLAVQLFTCQTTMLLQVVTLDVLRLLNFPLASQEPTAIKNNTHVIIFISTTLKAKL